MLGWLKENRRILTRFAKLAKSYAAMVSLACSMRCLRHLFSYRALKPPSWRFRTGSSNAERADVADNIRGALDTIDKNEYFIKLTLAVMMTPE
jgi:hypothetical protein